jgi:hypothetical protein
VSAGSHRRTYSTVAVRETPGAPRPPLWLFAHPGAYGTRVDPWLIMGIGRAKAGHGLFARLTLWYPGRGGLQIYAGYSPKTLYILHSHVAWVREFRAID